MTEEMGTYIQNEAYFERTVEGKSCGHIADLFDEQWHLFMKVTLVFRTLNTCKHPYSLSL